MYFGRDRARPAASARSLLPVGEDDRRRDREGIGRKTPAFRPSVEVAAHAWKLLSSQSFKAFDDDVDNVSVALDLAMRSE